MTIIKDRLIYRRQFLLARQTVPELNGWQRLQVGQYYLHVHPDLMISVAHDSNKTLTLLGYLFDPESYQSSNQEILQRVLAATKDFSSLILALKPYPGRYVVFYQDHGSLYLVHDALALREVYYCQRENLVLCGSQPNLLVRFSQPKIQESSDPELLDFVRNHLPQIRNGRLWVGDGTPYEAVKHLLPNHYLDLTRMESHRYWPNTQLSRIELDEAVYKCAAFLQGAMKAAAHRHPLMMAVTAGEDSRALLAASKEISSSVYFFINKHDKLNDRSSDIRIPKEIFRRIGIPFNVHQYPKDIPEGFKRIFLENTFYAKDMLLPEIYHVYYNQHSNKLNILGVGEVGRTKFFDEPKKLNPYYLAYMLRHRRSPYAVRECESWLESAKSVACRYKLNIMTLFWWEALIGNWGSVGNSESDIAIEEFDPYASHFLYEMFLSVDPKYRTFRDNILFEELIRFMWPQLLDVPVNPPDSIRGWLTLAIHKLGIENLLRKLKYNLYHFFYNVWWKRSKVQYLSTVMCEGFANALRFVSNRKSGGRI
ncbi:MAG: hypothetical protein ACFFCW_20470 [Candidatus Hodarchaeota archaeon]